jgi:hypothetical protein
VRRWERSTWAGMAPTLIRRIRIWTRPFDPLTSRIDCRTRGLRSHTEPGSMTSVSADRFLVLCWRPARESCCRSV